MKPIRQWQHPKALGPSPGANLERLLLTNSQEFFGSNNYFPSNIGQTATDKWRDTAQKIGSEVVNQKRAEEFNGVDAPDFVDDESLCNKRCCWWTPSQNSLPVAFCNETSIHGFKFMGQTKRHITERIFWLISFLLSLSAAVYLIFEVWDKYSKVPVIVTFQTTEQDIDSIPFPAVTLCNMNKFPKTKVQELQRISRLPYHAKYREAKQHLTFVRSVCNAQQSFSEEFHFAFRRGTNDRDSDNDTITEDSQDEMMDFLLENTIPCDELIRLCMLGEELRNCSDLFRPVITDYGKCCTFNILPLPLLLKNPQTFEKDNATRYDNPVLGSHGEDHWPTEELNEWKKWDYYDGFVLKPNLTRPWKQKRAGLPYGLSILIDPNTEEYFCPVSDSEGMRYILHTPLEMPHVMEFASVIDLNKEILIEIHPDMTNAEDDIRYIEQEKRKCYFGKEKLLKFFGPYTGGNCVDECTALVLGETCQCTFFYMPRDDGVRICNNDPDSADFLCIDQARIDLQSTLKDKCGHCDALCEDIAYNYETTIAELQNVKQLWLDPNPVYHGTTPPAWAHHKMSVVHIFFGSETTVPKFRKRLYGTTDLIANTGGILGLCLGFSVLSGVEVVYFITLRSFWKFCRRRMMGRRIAKRFIKMFKTRQNGRRVIRVNPNMIPVYDIPRFHRANGRSDQAHRTQFIPNAYQQPVFQSRKKGYYED